MANTPLTLFSHRVDPDGVLEILREAGPIEVVDGPGGWSSATLRWKTGLFSKRILTVNHAADYYSGPGWDRQLAGMRGYFEQFDARPVVGALIGSFRFALAMPDGEPPEDPDDPMHQVIRRLTSHLDGVLFLPGYFLDSRCRVLVAPDGEHDPDAVMPASVALSTSSDIEPLVDDDEDWALDPPDAQRVARRAIALAVMSARGLAEVRPDGDMVALRRDLRGWLDDVGVTDELEPDERGFLDGTDTPPVQQQVDATWRSEGLAVLGWGLRWWEMPAYDELATPPDMWRSVGLLHDTEKARTLISDAALQPPEELERMRLHLLMFDWRMVDYRVNPRPVDFVKLSKSCWVGSFPLAGYQIVDNDLAIGGVPVHEASPDVRSRAAGISVERHRAINWLCGYNPIYSDVDTST